MPKDYTATKLTGIELRFTIPAVDEEQKHYAARIQASATARNGVMQAPIWLPDELLGQARDVPWTPRQIYAATKAAPLNTIIARKLKELHLEGLNENIE